MDDLDRLYRRLVHNVQTTAPDVIGRSFEVSQIYQQFVPYRTNRRELGFAANDEYELALLQLLSGARGLLTGDSEMQLTLRRELESQNPDLSAYRAWAASAVSFAPDPLRAVLLRPTPEEGRAAAHASPTDQVVLAARPTVAVDTPDGEQTAAPESVPPAPLDPPHARTADPASPTPGPSSAPLLSSPMPVARPNPVRAAQGETCRYCGGSLPEGRSIVFCPGCGHNLTIKHCPACNTELEVGWKFCITCGREI
ncbi:MAG: double zinc ribbon domain-containing protein [Gemmatimonadaceae bacterium]